jgi:hypothetical protein
MQAPPALWPLLGGIVVLNAEGLRLTNKDRLLMLADMVHDCASQNDNDMYRLAGSSSFPATTLIPASINNGWLLYSTSKLYCVNPFNIPLTISNGLDFSPGGRAGGPRWPAPGEYGRYKQQYLLYANLFCRALFPDILNFSMLSPEDTFLQYAREQFYVRSVPAEYFSAVRKRDLRAGVAAAKADNERFINGLRLEMFPDLPVDAVLKWMWDMGYGHLKELLIHYPKAKWLPLHKW